MLLRFQKTDRVKMVKMSLNWVNLTEEHSLSSKFAWLMVQKQWIMVQWAACIIVQPAYWFKFSLDKRGTINQESLY